MFDHNFLKYSHSISERETLAIHVTRSWESTIAELEKLSALIESGHVKLIELKRLQEEYFNNDFKKFHEELAHLYGYFGKKESETRMGQVKLYNEFRLSHQAAIEIEKIHNELKLETKFDQLVDILNINSEEFQTWNLLKMDTKIERVVNSLRRVNHPSKIECLAAFAKCLDLVAWLRNHTNDLSELKTFVDMVSCESTVESLANKSSRIFITVIIWVFFLDAFKVIIFFNSS